MAKHLRITGIVQGVGYRAWFQSQAEALRLSGWVRNRTDGTVEAAVRGAPEAIEDMVVRARRGPPAASVQDVAVDEIDDMSVPAGRFEMLATR